MEWTATTPPAGRQAFDEVFSLSYEELRRLARAVLRDHAGAGITPTTLVNETWIKLSASPALAETSALHFKRIAGRAMRQVLVDAARHRHAAVHGGGHMRVTFDEALGLASVTNDRDLLALDTALDELATIAPRQAQLVEARFFGGYSCEECAELFGISEATVMRDWRTARAWLACEVKRALVGPASVQEVGPS
jgi:RNA polymerase sigma-70 factor, ECF subfamily